MQKTFSERSFILTSETPRLLRLRRKVGRSIHNEFVHRTGYASKGSHTEIESVNAIQN